MHSVGICHAIDEFVDWYCSEPRLAFNRIVVLRYRTYLENRQLASGTINCGWGPCAALRMRPPTVVFSALTLRPTFGESRASRSWACAWELVDGRTRHGTLACARQPSHERKAGSGPSGLAFGMRT